MDMDAEETPRDEWLLIWMRVEHAVKEIPPPVLWKAGARDEEEMNALQDALLDDLIAVAATKRIVFFE
jgi:hypothetical protein